MITLELPFPPSVNRIWRRGKARGSVYLNPKYKAWRKEADVTIIQARREGRARVWGRFTANIVLDQRRRYTKKNKLKKIDADNYIKPLLDCLQRMLVIDDDALADKVTTEWGEANGARITLVPTYDANRDFSESINDCYRAVRKRKAAGGKGWPP